MAGTEYTYLTLFLIFLLSWWQPESAHAPWEPIQTKGYERGILYGNLVLLAQHRS
jgi:hypothetical protein